MVNSVVANASYAGVLTVKADGDEFDTKAITVTGGKGTSDVLEITADGNAIVTARMANVTNVETVKIRYNSQSIYCVKRRQRNLHKLDVVSDHYG